MSNLTTIPEICKTHSLHPNTVRWLLNNSLVIRQTDCRKIINGFSGHLYLKEDAEVVIKKYLDKKALESIAKITGQKANKKYSNIEICQVLRKHLSSYLNNKVVSLWNYHDWKEFEKLKQPKAS